MPECSRTAQNACARLEMRYSVRGLEGLVDATNLLELE